MRIEDEEIRRAFERRASGRPRARLLVRILRATRPMRSGPTVIPFPGQPVRLPLYRRVALIATAGSPIVLVLVAVLGLEIVLFGAQTGDTPRVALPLVIHDSAVSVRDDDEDEDEEADDGDEHDGAGRGGAAGAAGTRDDDEHDDDD